MAKEQKVYMPLMIGDWLKGTRGMKAEIRGVYINLLLFQWDNGFIPSDMDELFLIDPEVGKVWDKLKEKFQPAGPGKLQNKKNEEVREFWKKQAKNGSQGGRPKKEKPDNNPNINPKDNPNHNLHNDLDIDSDIELRLKGAFDEIYLDQQKIKWPHLDFLFEFRTFCEKVRGSPGHYAKHETEGLRLALQSQLRNAKKNGTAKNKREQNSSELREAFAKSIVQEFGDGGLHGSG
jgi:uncharacterized protein YdaU (DUF1376 family)